MKKLIAGIPAEHWTLFRLHAEARDAEQILARLRTELMREESELSRESVQQITEAVRQIVDLFK